MNKEQAQALRKPFPPETIGTLPKGGTQLRYVGHAAVTDRLLEVDPEWNWEPFATTEHGLPALDEAGNLWIRLTVNGVTRPGVGDGNNMKERIGDAIRNAAIRFGVALDLWSKDELESNIPEPDAGLLDLIDAATTLDELRELWKQARTKVERDAITSRSNAIKAESAGEQA